MPTDFNQDIICEAAEVQIIAAEGESSGPAKFNVVAYTGGAMSISGWDLPVVIDLDGLQFGKSLVANLDHDRTKRVGNVTSKMVNSGTLVLGGVASAATESRREVIESASGGFVWQASVEVQPSRVETIAKGKSVEVNGQSFEGPLYVTRSGTLKGFAFVSHGADDNTQVSIAASAEEPKKGKTMNAEFKSWVESIGFDADNLTETQRVGLEANFSGKQSPKPEPIKASDPFAARKIEARRREDIRQIADRMIEMRDSDFAEITEIEKMVAHAIDANMSSIEFRVELQESMLPSGPRITNTESKRNGITPRVIEAAICQAGRLSGHENAFSDQELQSAQTHFRNGIGLKELILLCARENGYKNGHSYDVNDEVMRFAFGHAKEIRASSGFSTNSISTILSNNANKFLMDGWNAVDMTPMRIAPVRSVRDFKQITTVSLTGDLQYEKVGSTGEIKHGTLGNESYTNQASTYARMMAIPRTDIINDDLGALTAVPRRLGRGAALKLNDIFWTTFLDNSAFFTTARGNANEGVADMTIGGLTATEVLFMNQTDPDSKPLGIMPAILLVPTALKAAAVALSDPQSQMISTGSTDSTIPNVNVFRGRFRVESSPYISNASYTGYSAAAWYMLADPNEMPVVEIAALNGRVEPVVETADADFNTLGIQMRGYSDVGVAMQEYRGGVRADGGAS